MKSTREMLDSGPVKLRRASSLYETSPVGVTEEPVPDAGKTRVDSQTQRKRDDERRQILEEELTREQAGLSEARRALSEQEATRMGDERNYQRVQERLKPFQEAVGG